MGSAAPNYLPDASVSARARAVCAVVRAEVRPGAGDVFEALLRDFAEEVAADEPGCASYVVTRTFGSRTHFAVHARFLGWPGFRAHGETEHAKRLLPRLTALLAAPISMELFLEI
jgi:quinol monooxygenase YgiN